MFFGIFGSIFLLAQFFQTVQGYSPLEAGLRTLPWTGMPMLVAPIAGHRCRDRIGSRPLMAAGLALQAVAIVLARARSSTPDVAYGAARAAVRDGAAPAWRSCSRRPPTPCSARCARRRPARRRARRTRSASSAACSASPCWPRCSPARAASSPPQAFVDGLTRRCWVGAAVLAVGALVALLVPRGQAAPDGRRGRAGRGCRVAASRGRPRLRAGAAIGDTPGHARRSLEGRPRHRLLVRHRPRDRRAPRRAPAGPSTRPPGAPRRSPHSRRRAAARSRST